MRYGHHFSARDLSQEGLLANLDDGHVKLEFKTPFIIDGEKFHSVFVNVDGLVTFDAPSSSFDSNHVEGPYLAPFWGDIDLTGEVEDGNTIRYRVSESEQDIDWVRIALQESVESSFEWRPTTVVVATWDHVGHFMSQTDLLNTFQVVLATDGIESYAFYNYPPNGINWWMSEQGQPSVVGFRTRKSEYTVQESRMADIVRVSNNTNARVAGRRLTKLDGTRPLLSQIFTHSAPCFFGGSSVEINGFGFQNTGDSLLCRFTSRRMNTETIITSGTFISTEEVTCDVPAWKAHEMINVSVSTDGGSKWSDPISFMMSDCILSYHPVHTCASQLQEIKNPGQMIVESFPNPWNPEKEYFCKFGENELTLATVDKDSLSCSIPTFSSPQTVELKVVVKDGDRSLESREFGKLYAEQCTFIINKMEACSSKRRTLLLWEDNTDLIERIGKFGIITSPTGKETKFEVGKKLIEVFVPENGTYELSFENGLSFSFDVDC